MKHTLIYVRGKNGIKLQFPKKSAPTDMCPIAIDIFATTVDHTDRMKAINSELYDEVIQKLTTAMSRLDEKEDCIIFIFGGRSVAMCNNFTNFLAEDNVLDVDKLLKHLYKDNEILLIVGIADGLETELVDDIRVTCRKAGLESRIDSILSKCSSTSDEKPEEIVERSDHTLLRIIVSPTIQEFEEFMKRAILESCCRLSLTIVYCGHGTQAGAICLFDGDYGGTELKELLDKQCVSHFPAYIHLCLNCCYAINVASETNDEDELQQLIYLFPSIDDTHIKQESLRIISQAYYGDQNANDTIQKLMKDKLKDRSFFHRSWHQLRLYVFPLSVGILKAQGLLCVALEVQQTTNEAQQVQPLKFRSRWYEKEDHKECLNKLFAPKAPLLPKDSSTPKVKVFGAKHGDSALFRWKKWNVLIDGGYYVSKDPCFRETVCRLNQLDLVVLTHGDDDHIKGLLPLFKKLSNDKKDDPTTYKKFVKKAAFLHPDMQNQRTWSQAKMLYRYANDAEIECTGITTLEFPGPNKKIKLVIKFIHPPPEGNLLERAITELQNARSDLINESSLVVCIECWTDDTTCEHRFLFTGDSYGKDVIKALENNNLLDKEFTYVDMPHHGSKKNHPAMFLGKINTKNIGVSTDGSRKSKHPDMETLEKLSEYLVRNSSCHLYFNYKQGDKYDNLIAQFEHRVHCPLDDQTSGFEVPS